MESGIVIFFLTTLFSSDQIRADTPVYKSPEIYSLHIVSDVKFRFATTLVTSKVKNPSPVLREAKFDVTLPNEAFISDFTLEIEGQIINGEVKEKEAAKQQYVAAQQRGESAGYIGTKERETNRFTLSVSVAPESKVTFNLTYQELLKRQHGFYEQVIFIDPGQVVPEMEVTVSILESREITHLTVPPMSNDVDFNIDGSLSVISQPTPKSAYVKYIPSVEAQADQSENGVAGKFKVRYDVDREMDAGDVLLVNGYFVHFFAPEGFQPIPNDVLFILDTSGSMGGTKIHQLKDAMMTILSDMQEGDRIDIMTFSTSFRFWKNEMVDIMDEDVMEEAKSYVNQLTESGGTNIEGALRNGLSFMSKYQHSFKTRMPIIVFLTDGEPTSGVTSSHNILESVRNLNSLDIPIFTLAFGRDADYDLVKKIAIQNNGIGRKIYDGSDADIQITGFYSEIAVTLLSNISFSYLDAPVKDVTNSYFKNYFNGSELVVCGFLDEDYRDFDNETGDDTEVSGRFLSKFTVHGNSRSGPSVLVITDDLVLDDVQSENLTSVEDYEEITEKVWAYLTIKQLLDKQFATEDQTEAASIKDRILSLSLRFGFVTPVTSMVVTLPTNNTSSEEDEIEDLLINTEQLLEAEPPVKSYMKQSAQRLPPLPDVSNWYPVRSQPAHFQGMVMGHGNTGLMHEDVGLLPSFHHVPRVPVQRRRKNYIGSKFVKNNRMRDRKRTMMKKKDKKKKDRRKNRKVKKDLPVYPLMLHLPSTKKPICFRLHSMSGDDEQAFKLYSDSGSNIVMFVKKTQNSTEDVQLVQALMIDNGSPISITSKYKNGAVKLNTTSEGLSITVLSYKDGSLSVRVSLTDKSCTDISPCGQGVLSQIIDKAIRFGKRTSSTKKIIINKNKVRLNMKKTRFGRCWEMPKLSEDIFSFETVRKT